jgi:hypothetical protein
MAKAVIRTQYVRICFSGERIEAVANGCSEVVKYLIAKSHRNRQVELAWDFAPKRTIEVSVFLTNGMTECDLSRKTGLREGAVSRFF